MSRANHDLQEANGDLQSQVKEAMRINARLAEASHASDEMTQRLADMEKRVQKALQEKEALQAENKVGLFIQTVMRKF